MRKIFKKLREKLKAEAPDELQALLEELRTMSELGFSDFQHIEDFAKDWKIDTARNVDGNSCILRTYSDEAIVIETWIPPNGSFSKHWHNKTETVEVLAGVLRDHIVTPKMKYSKGQMIQYKPYERHMPYNPSDENTCHLLVTFNL